MYALRVNGFSRTKKVWEGVWEVQPSERNADAKLMAEKLFYFAGNEG